MNAALRQCLMERNFAAARSIALETNPAWSVPDDSWLVEVWGHMTRTTMQTITPRERYYSHRWLLDHGKASLLPDRLKPSAERMYPKKVKAVGIALTGRSGPEACGMIQGAMQNAVLDCYASGDTDSAIVKSQMMRARFRERKALMLPIKWDVPAEWRP